MSNANLNGIKKLTNNLITISKTRNQNWKLTTTFITRWVNSCNFSQSSNANFLKFQGELKFRPDGFPAKTRGFEKKNARTILQLNARGWKVNRGQANQGLRKRRYPEFISNRYSIWFAEWNSLMQIFIAAPVIPLSRINRLTDRCFFRPVIFSVPLLKFLPSSNDPIPPTIPLTIW